MVVINAKTAVMAGLLTLTTSSQARELVAYGRNLYGTLACCMLLTVEAPTAWPSR